MLVAVFVKSRKDGHSTFFSIKAQATKKNAASSTSKSSPLAYFEHSFRSTPLRAERARAKDSQDDEF